MKSAIITGSNGQDGPYLAEILRRNYVDPVLVPRASGIDLRDPIVVADLITNANPDYIFHLAADSTVSHQSAPVNHAVIATGTFNILEMVMGMNKKCRVFLPGSAYQFVNYGGPVNEFNLRSADSVYCAAREYSRNLAEIYRRMGALVYFGYLFHHESPRRSERHISQKIALAAKRRAMVEIRDPSEIKEWTWAGDTMEAVWALVNQDQIFECNIGSGIGHSIEEFARLCYHRRGMDYREFVQTPADYLPSHQSLTANPGRIKSLGWEPRHDIEFLADQMTK